MSEGSRAAGLRPGRDHLPPARLLGPHGPAAALGGRGQGQRLKAGLLVLGRARAQGDQATARRRRLAAVGPAGRRVLARGPRRRPGLGQPGAHRDEFGLARSNGEVVDLLAGGQGVFNIVPLAGVVDEFEADIVRLDAPGRSAAPRSPPLDVSVARAAGGERRRPAHDRVHRGATRPPSGVAPPAGPFRPSLRGLFAALLDLVRRALGVRTRRVPTQVGRGGHAVRGFRPDFYLPSVACSSSSRRPTNGS